MAQVSNRYQVICLGKNNIGIESHWGIIDTKWNKIIAEKDATPFVQEVKDSYKEEIHYMCDELNRKDGIKYDITP